MTTQSYLIAKYSNITFIGALPTTAILAFFLLHERITIEKIVLIAFGFLGVVLVSVHDFSHLLRWGTGEFMAFVANFFFSISYIGRKWQSDVLNDKESVLLMLGISSVLLFICSLFFGEDLPGIVHFTPGVFAVIGIAALFNIVYLQLINFGFRRVEGVLASNILMLESVFGLLLSIILFREVPSIKELIGGFLIVACAYRLNKIIS